MKNQEGHWGTADVVGQKERCNVKTTTTTTTRVYASETFSFVHIFVRKGVGRPQIYEKKCLMQLAKLCPDNQTFVP